MGEKESAPHSSHEREKAAQPVPKNGVEKGGAEACKNQ